MSLGASAPAPAPGSGHRFLIGVDVGGTFTDLVAMDGRGTALLTAKVPSMPGAQWRGVLAALAELGIESSAIGEFVHGTTIATNALLERKGARTALVTTRGFRDVLEIGKGRRLAGGLFDTRWQRPEPIVPRDRRLELDERTAADGTVLVEPAPADFEALASALRALGVEAVAVSLINACVGDRNERESVAALDAALGDVPVVGAAELVRERGEFERTSTAVLNAYLTPVMTDYLSRLKGELADHGVSAPVNIMGSNGGAMTLEGAARRCAGTFLSGPVGGVAGALRVAELAGVRDLITFDMGGTSTDVALIHDLAPRMSHDNQIDAYPLQMPQLDIHTIGAGGGSIAWQRPDGTLDVGPRSAGAMPGPACYGRGGDQPTISDANLLLGRLPTRRALSGGLRLDRAASRSAFTALGRSIGADDVVALADATLAIAVAKMAGAVREVSVHRGFDPRAFTLLGFGGAGPMHVFAVAAELGVRRVLVPRFPGHLSALGQMLADVRHDYVIAWGGRTSEVEPEALRARADTMREEADRVLAGEGVSAARRRFEFTLDVRYAGQSFTLPIRWSPDQPGWTALRAAFDARHAETFGYADESNDAEIVNVRLVAIGLVERPALDLGPRPTAGDPALEERDVWFDGWVGTPVLARDRLAPGARIEGPVIIEEAGGTHVVPPGWRLDVDESGALMCEHRVPDSPDG